VSKTKKKADSGTPSPDEILSSPDELSAIEESDDDWLDDGFVDPSEIISQAQGEAEFPGRFEVVPVDSCRPNEWNPNEMNDKQFDMLCRRIKEVGMISPIQVVPTVDSDTGEEYYTIIGGEHRWRAVKALHWTTVPAIILTDERMTSKDMQKFVTMQLNMITGKLNPEKFVKLYQDMVKRYENERLRDMMGFTDVHRWSMLTKSIAEGLPEDLRKEFKKKASKAKSPNEFKKILEDLLGRYGDDMRFNFMIFSHEGLENIWIRLNEEALKKLIPLLDMCRARSIDVNDMLVVALTHAAEHYGVE
jgi:hypothetical protein